MSDELQFVAPGDLSILRGTMIGCPCLIERIDQAFANVPNPGVGVSSVHLSMLQVVVNARVYMKLL